MIASEADPFAKTGGLADVMEGLPTALSHLGEEVAVMLPRYRSAIPYSDHCVLANFSVSLGPTVYPVSIYCTKLRDVMWYFADCPELFDREAIYGAFGTDYADNHVRFAVLSQAALEFDRRMYNASIIHGHDWQAALASVYLRSSPSRRPEFSRTRTVFTVHNLAFQGIFPESSLADIGLDQSLFNSEAIEYYGRINLLKGGVLYSDAVTTVSRRYAQEIQTPEWGCGLDGVFRTRRAVIRGILNGVDYRNWNPETDLHLRANYSANDFGGKKICREELLHEVGLSGAIDDGPVVGVVTRLAAQKGFDIQIEALPGLLKSGFRFVILGNGESAIQDALQRMAADYPNRLAAVFTVDNALAHRIMAGCDVFLMPSRWEPCGSNQLFALRYGTIPVVRAIGGLDETVDATVGFKFQEYSAAALTDCLHRARELFLTDRGVWTDMMRRAMSKDYSWRYTATEYSRLYRELLLEPIESLSRS